jgi:hypothetical protein
VWTFQEYLLSTNLIFLCGEESISGKTLMAGLEALLEDSDPPTEDPRMAIEYFGTIRMSTRAVQLRDLITAWMNITRPFEWNHQKIRQPLPSTSYKCYYD